MTNRDEIFKKAMAKRKREIEEEEENKILAAVYGVQEWIIDWDYDESVEKMLIIVPKWKNITVDMLKELWVAREALSFQGYRTDIFEEGRTWSNYCKEIGLSYQSATRWLKRYDAENNRLIEKLPAPCDEKSIAKKRESTARQYIEKINNIGWVVKEINSNWNSDFVSQSLKKECKNTLEAFLYENKEIIESLNIPELIKYTHHKDFIKQECEKLRKAKLKKKRQDRMYKLREEKDNLK